LKFYIVKSIDVLVSPVRCVERFSQLNPEEINDLFLSTQLIARKIEEFYQAKSLSIAIQDGEYAGQTVKVFNYSYLKKDFLFFLSMFTFTFFQGNPVILMTMILFIIRLIIYRKEKYFHSLLCFYF
jgi:hypothetical protein